MLAVLHAVNATMDDTHDTDGRQEDRDGIDAAGVATRLAAETGRPVDEFVTEAEIPSLDELESVDTGGEQS